MKQKIVLIIVYICLIHCGINAQSRDAVKTSTDILMFATPAAGFITTLVTGDYKPEFGISHSQKNSSNYLSSG